LRGRLLSVNALPTKILGYSREELLGKPMREFLLEETRPQFDEYLERIQKEGSAHGVIMVLAKSGEKRLWEYHNKLEADHFSNE
jgi:PAS domain S-box-containing protein